MVLIDEMDVQQALCQHLYHRRKQKKYSRATLAERSGVPASTIKHFERTGQISLRQFLRLWLCLDELPRLYALTQPANHTSSPPCSHIPTPPSATPTYRRPTSIAEVLRNEL